MRPGRTTPAHETDRMAELVCSNSLGSNLPDRALGLLKNELRRLGSLIIACADRTAVPAGDALAVGREAFSQAVTEAVAAHPNITVRREEVTAIPAGRVAVIIATGPLTSPALAEAIRDLAGQDYLYFFDAMAPIVDRREHRHGRSRGAGTGGTRDGGAEAAQEQADERGRGSHARRAEPASRRLHPSPSSIVATTSTVRCPATSTSRSWRR